MKTRCVLLAAGAWLAAGAACFAFDNVTRVSDKPIAGRVESISRTNVRVMKGTGALPVDVPVKDIAAIYFDDEPSMMINVRNYLKDGRYNDAMTALERINPKDVNRDEVKADIEFYGALCTAKMALGGSGTPQAAGKKMYTFVKNNPNSYHYFEACELLGDLLVAVGNFSTAETYYAKLAAVPWPEYQMRAGVALGRAQLAQGKAKIPQALQSFEKVLKSEASTDLAMVQRRAATLGKARCLAAGGRPDEAITMVESVIAKAEASQVDLHARAYNALGTALRQANRNMDALMAFLHVDLLYFGVPEAHAEALFNLAELWGLEQKPERAARCRRLLDERYRNSTWAKKE